MKHNPQYKILIALGFLSASSMAGCGILPASGPFSGNMEELAIKQMPQLRNEKEAELRYAIVQINQKILKSNIRKIKNEAHDWPDMGKSRVGGVSVGDTISVTVYEAGTGGLFIPQEAGVRPGNFITIPSQIIDGSGTISIPYAGEIQAAGRSTVEIGDEIVEKLGVRAIEPQVVVSILERRGAEVSVVGAVNNSSKFTLGFNSEKILDAIAKAGGPSFPGYETVVALQRGGREWTVPFNELVQNPDMNIYLQAKDTIYLERRAPAFQTYGATGLMGSFNFTKNNMTLSEAIGEARGLADGLADPEEVYLYRPEDLKDLEKAGIVLDYADADIVDGKIPVIYKINLRAANGFFLAQQFPVEDKDIIYIANAEAVEFTKFLELLNPTAVTKINTHNAIDQ